MPLTGGSPDAEDLAAAGAGGGEEERPRLPSRGMDGVARVAAAWA